MLQTQQNRLDVAKQIQDTNAEAALKAKEAATAEATAITDALRPLQEQKRILEATLNGRAEEERLLIQIETIMRGLPKEQLEVVEGLVRGNAELQKQAEQAAELEQLYDQVSARIQSGIVDGITAAIDGTKELSEILSDVLKDVGKMFLQFAVKSAFSGLGFANGGRPPMNQVSVIGERGPELFVPDSAGTVLSNSQSRAAMNRYAPNNNGEGGGGSNETFRLETIVINNVEYATVDQLRAMGKASAKEGAAAGNAMTMNKLRNSRSQRSKIGLR